jgi:hypothetical protein
MSKWRDPEKSKTDPRDKGRTLWSYNCGVMSEREEDDPTNGGTLAEFNPWNNIST